MERAVKILYIAVSTTLALGLLTCGVIEGIQENDSVKTALVIAWVTTLVTSWTWRRRALFAKHLLLELIEKRMMNCPICGAETNVFCPGCKIGIPEASETD